MQNYRLFIESAVAVFCVILGACLNRWFQRKARIIAFTTPPGHIRMKDGGVISCHNLILRNDGKKEAKNLQVIHVNLPDFQVLPAIKYSREQLQDGTAIIFPTLVPGEQITICYIYPGEFFGQIHGVIKHEEGQADYINVLLTKQYSKATLWVLRVLIIFGIISVLYLLLLLIKKLL